MPQLRIFVVDDSAVYRKVLLETINSIPGVRAVGVAADGREALDAIPHAKPDLITLDLNMPVMDGLETLKQLNDVYPQFKVIMVSSHTFDGAQATIQALQAGALDFICKPDSSDKEQNGRLLYEQLSALFSKYADFQKESAAPKLSPKQSFGRNVTRQKEKPQVIALGISTGGPNALGELLPALPGSFPLPIVIVQHMPKLFTKSLAESLQKKCSIKVVEAQNGEVLRQSTAYIAPGGFQMKVRRNELGEVVVQITDDPSENHCKPSVDYLFRSVAQVCGANSVGVIMTGMGCDGVLGLKLMKRLGAQVIAQDKDSCTVWGMPRVALEAGVVDQQLSLQEIAPELIRMAGGRSIG